VLARDNHQVQPDQQPSSGQKTAILDSVAWCRRCDDDAELLSEVSMLFGNTCDDAIKQIEESLDRKDQSGVVSAAHLLKGSVTNMCASQALHVSEQVELTARRSDLIGVNNLMPELKTEIQKLRQAIEDMFSASIDEADHHILARVQNQGASV
jgi:HPt (histidine-containing phosphotransfer) domain-containing protein